jgi:hypothetical protein
MTIQHSHTVKSIPSVLRHGVIRNGWQFGFRWWCELAPMSDEPKSLGVRQMLNFIPLVEAETPAIPIAQDVGVAPWLK